MKGKRPLYTRLKAPDQRANQRRRRSAIARAARETVRALSNPFGCTHHELEYCSRCVAFILPLRSSP